MILEFSIIWNLDCTLFFNNPSLYSIFAHFFFCKRTCDKKKQNIKNVIVIFVPEFILKFLTVEMLFMISLLMNEILFVSSMNVLRKSLFFSWYMSYSFIIYLRKKAKIFGCTYGKDIKSPNKLFRAFLNILIRIYLNYFLNLLNELELKDEPAIFFR